MAAGAVEMAAIAWPIGSGSNVSEITSQKESMGLPVDSGKSSGVGADNVACKMLRISEMYL